MAGSAILKIDVLMDAAKAVSGFKSVGDEAKKQTGTVQTFGQKTSGVTDSLAKTALAGLGLGTALGVAGAAIGKAITAASDLQQATGAVEKVFEDSADEVDVFAKAAAEAMGLAESEYKSMAAVLGASMKNAGVPVDELAEKTNDLMQRAADMSAVFGGPVDEAMGAFQSALRGEFDPIEKFGVGLTAASIEARAMEMGLIDANDEMDRTAKVAAITEEILDQTADSAGAFAEEADTLAGATARMNAKLENFAANSGSKVIPAIEGLIDGLDNAIFEIAFLDATMAGANKGNELFALGIEGARKHLKKGESEVEALAEALIFAADNGVAPTTKAFKQQAKQMDLSLGQTRWLADEIGHLTNKGDISRESAYELMRMLNQQASAMETAREDGRFLSDRYQLLADDAEDAAEKAAGYRQELRRQARQTRLLTDPVFALRDAQRDYNAAFEAWSELAVSGTATADELRQPKTTSPIAHLDLEIAQGDVEKSAGLMEDAWNHARAEAGLLTDITLQSKDAIDQWSDAVNNAPRWHPGTGTSGGEVPVMSGGPVFAGGMYTVGEAGRELFVPSVSGRILPHFQTERMLTGSAVGGGGSTYVMNMYRETGGPGGCRLGVPPPRAAPNRKVNLWPSF